jgi:spectinomycin phosphotransferase
MKTPPTLDYPTLLDHIRAVYGLAAQGLRFLPEGETSYGFILTCDGGERYFLKLFPDTRQGQYLRERQRFVLPVVYELYERGLFPNLAPPVLTHLGTFMVDFESFALIVFRFIEGQEVDCAGADSAAVRKQLALAYARLHRAAPMLRSALPPFSPYEMGFTTGLRDGFAALKGIGADARPALHRLHSLLLPREGQVYAWVAETEGLLRQVEQDGSPRVLCHTDMGDNNVLIDASGQIQILDWDWMILAPPEHDLALHAGPGFASFLELYWEAGGLRPLCLAQFVFYLKRRYLADLTDWLLRLLEENQDPIQDENDLYGLERYALNNLEHFDQETKAIERAIA